MYHKILLLATKNIFTFSKFNFHGLIHKFFASIVSNLNLFACAYLARKGDIPYLAWQNYSRQAFSRLGPTYQHLRCCGEDYQPEGFIGHIKV